MDKHDIERYLQMLGEELARRQRHGRILLVGGAVMLLVIGNRNSTRDIDASFEDEGPAIRNAAREIAKRERLPPDWINDGAKGFLYSTPPISLWNSYPCIGVFAGNENSGRASTRY